MKKKVKDMIFDYIIDNMHSTDIDKSMVHGHGLYAKTEIKRDEVLGYLDGQNVPWDVYSKTINKLVNENNLNDLFIEWNAIEIEMLLVRPFRTKYSYINHSRTPNLKILRNPIRVVAICDIPRNTELFLDYRMENLNDEYINGHGKTYL